MNRTMRRPSKAIPKRPKASFRAKEHREDSSPFAKKALKSFLLTVGVGILGIVVASLAVYFTPDPDPLIRPVGLAVCAVVSLIGGIIAGKIHRTAPAVCGTVNGLLLVAVLLLLSLFFRDIASGYSAWVSALLHAGVILLSFVGALLATAKKR